MEERLREEMERIIRVKSPEKVLETIRGKALKPKVKIGFGKGRTPGDRGCDRDNSPLHE